MGKKEKGKGGEPPSLFDNLDLFSPAPEQPAAKSDGGGAGEVKAAGGKTPAPKGSGAAGAKPSASAP